MMVGSSSANSAFSRAFASVLAIVLMDRGWAPITAARPGEQVQMDATVLDVVAVMAAGVIGRPEPVLAVDIGTGTFLRGCCDRWTAKRSMRRC